MQSDGCCNSASKFSHRRNRVSFARGQRESVPSKFSRPCVQRRHKKTSHELRKLMRRYKTIFVRFCKEPEKSAILWAFSAFCHQKLLHVTKHCILMSPIFALCNLNLHLTLSSKIASTRFCHHFLHYRSVTIICISVFVTKDCTLDVTMFCIFMA